MKLFYPFHKSTFWSQIFFGVIAIFALPNAQPLANECEQEPVINQYIQGLAELSAVQKTDIEQAHLLHLEQQPLFFASQQAVVYSPFFAKSYRFDSVTNPPIRAGPSV
ncbi:secA translation cis-regulator SecM [Glaesserella sp.]|uniref:secA translation cis-regulator SecM n=1 Tax=Glaesserella sp. TaxID=2094731 RepID=UPI00359F330F